MSRLFSRHLSVRTRRPPDQDAEDPTSAYESLLEDGQGQGQQQDQPSRPQQHRRSHSNPRALTEVSSQAQQQQRHWLSADAARRNSWTGERAPAKKLVKEPSGSARPSFSVEISDSDGDGEKKGVVRRKMERLMGLYRGVK